MEYSIPHEIGQTSQVRKLKDCLALTLDNANLKDASVQLFIQENPLAADAEITEFRGGGIKPPQSICSYPILYHRKQIGLLNLTEPANDSNAQVPVEVSRKIALLIKRFQATSLTKQHLGLNIGLLGQSDQVLTIESFIEKASNTSCPVIVEGEFGCEKLAVASAIHYNSNIKHKPFLEINCSVATFSEFRDTLLSGIQAASNGTIYLSDVDQLSFSQQNLLVELLSANSNTPESHYGMKNMLQNTRLIASSAEELHVQVSKNRFSKRLYSILNFLTVSIPPLRERRADIPEIVRDLVEKYKVYDEQCLSDEVVNRLVEFNWPENIVQLERVMARLLSLSNTNPVRIDELEKYAPEVFEAQSSAKNQASVMQLNLVNNLLAGDLSSFKSVHVKLQKALEFLALHFKESITLGCLANHAYVSESHLSYLFKQFLSRSFKQILAEMRIEQAKRIFKQTPHARITDVSLEVGFGDLSHFEKTFKRFTQLTPREYKKKQKS
ncbi:hypothetical protein C2869_14050 [Saccharobesus litoralis]|uniref:Uncharacterized protein n=1 Tax=Saccharobesus litoralis TaxID=2172099 RepID=A0A2S0VTI9_9ALTE|nr:AraC family transcriptional regulator [Saccharobesus litoralis]AWB67492.1 hypothetical protein C2869_14050 [Saccharobesus litoralis]